jgi:hypothetical protein
LSPRAIHHQDTKAPRDKVSSQVWACLWRGGPGGSLRAGRAGSCHLHPPRPAIGVVAAPAVTAWNSLRSMLRACQVLHNKWFFGPLLALIWPFCTQKPVRFEHSKNSKSCICNRWLSSFRRNSIFFAFPASFPFAGSISSSLAAGCRRSLVTTRIGYHSPVLVSRTNCRRREGKCQAPGYGGWAPAGRVSLMYGP